MADFPKVKDGNRSYSLRFSLPSLKFGKDTIAAYEAECGVPYLSLLEAVLTQDNPGEASDIQDLIKKNKICTKAESAAQGMLFYLYRLYTTRSRVGAVTPPINTSMVVWWRKKYEFFDELVNEFEHEMCDAAEDELYLRAVVGTETPVVVNGQVEYVIKKSDDLLKFYLTHNKPKRYSQKTEVKSSVNVDANIKADVTLGRSAFAHLSDEELAAMEEMLNRGKDA